MSLGQMGSDQITTGFASMADFLSMGGHGFYVWLAYGAGLLVFLFLLLEPVVRRRRLREQLRAFYRREQVDAQSDERSAS